MDSHIDVTSTSIAAVYVDLSQEDLNYHDVEA